MVSQDLDNFHDHRDRIATTTGLPLKCSSDWTTQCSGHAWNDVHPGLHWCRFSVGMWSLLHNPQDQPKWTNNRQQIPPFLNCGPTAHTLSRKNWQTVARCTGGQDPASFHFFSECRRTRPCIHPTELDHSRIFGKSGCFPALLTSSRSVSAAALKSRDSCFVLHLRGQHTISNTDSMCHVRKQQMILLFHARSAHCSLVVVAELCSPSLPHRGQRGKAGHASCSRQPHNAGKLLRFSQCKQNRFNCTSRTHGAAPDTCSVNQASSTFPSLLTTVRNNSTAVLWDRGFFYFCLCADCILCGV